jgi:hypothetical protein
VNQSLVGFTNVSDNALVNTFPTYSRQERALLASNGVSVLTGRAGNVLMLDPKTTEGGSGKLAEFEEIQASNMKDDVVTAVNDTVTANLVGVVPSSLSGFVSTVKHFIANAIEAKIAAGVIGPYKDASGASRALDTSLDMVIYQSAIDPRQFNYKYYFNLRYPALRFFGEFSVDNPFF